jgi:hypothetical protein
VIALELRLACMHISEETNIKCCVMILDSTYKLYADLLIEQFRLMYASI